MKRIVLAGILIALPGYHLTAEARPENDFKVKVVLQEYEPVEDETFGDSSGWEAQIQSWVMPDVGFALAVGQSTWDIQPSGAPAFTDVDVVFDGTRAGDLDIISFGLSAFYRVQPLSFVRLQGEAGFRYLRIDSSIVHFATRTSESPPRRIGKKIESDDAVVLVIAGEIELVLHELISLFAGVGYQNDLERPEFTTNLERGGEFDQEASLNAFFARLGAAISF